jgi:hypothetical protein
MYGKNLAAVRCQDAIGILRAVILMADLSGALAKESPEYAGNPSRNQDCWASDRKID